MFTFSLSLSLEPRHHIQPNLVFTAPLHQKGFNIFFNDEGPMRADREMAKILKLLECFLDLPKTTSQLSFNQSFAKKKPCVKFV